MRVLPPVVGFASPTDPGPAISRIVNAFAQRSVTILSGFPYAGFDAVMADLRRRCGMSLRLIKIPSAFARPAGEIDGVRGCARALEALARRVDRHPSFVDVCLVAGPAAEPRLIHDRWRRAQLATPAARGLSIGALVTIVDVDAFEDDFAHATPLRERGWGSGADDGRLVPDLLAEQIEYADLVVLSSARECSPDGCAGYVERVVKALSPDARVVRASHGRLDRADFGFVDAGVSRARAAAWARAWEADEQRSGSAGEGRRFLYRARAPFHPARLARCLLDGWPGALRLKGRLWLASRPAEALAVSLAGGALRVFRAGHWWASVPIEHWPQNHGSRAAIWEAWHPRFGDRYQRIAVVGLGIDCDAVTRALDTCLLTEHELASGASNWVELNDPFVDDDAPEGQLTVPADRYANPA